MKRIIQLILVSLLSLIVFLTTSGFYVFEHHCLHSGTVRSSVLWDFIDCHLDHSQTKSDLLSLNSERCCKLIKLYYKLESSFEKTEHQEICNPIIIEKQYPQLEMDYIPVLEKEFRLDYAINAPPIIRKLFVFITTQQLKLSPPVC
jgi:hypothetical protein